MPPKGYRSITIREEVYGLLEKITAEKGFKALGDAVEFLISAYRKPSSSTLGSGAESLRPAGVSCIVEDKIVSYYVECSDGFKVITKDVLNMLFERYKNIVIDLEYRFSYGSAKLFKVTPIT